MKKIAIILSIFSAALAMSASASESGYSRSSDKKEILSIIDGASNVSLTKKEVLALNSKSYNQKTPWFSGKKEFSGPLLKDVLLKAKVSLDGKSKLVVTALDDYKISIPVSDISAFEPILATKINGKELAISDKGPYFVIYPYFKSPSMQNERFYAKSIWQVKKIEVLK